ncbi:MAG: ABC transporter permease [Clostridia bacterium]|nr:ABC transporter permease [Clostridia bacterium]
MKKSNSLKIFSTYTTYLFLIAFVLIPTLFIIVVSFLKADSLGNIKLMFTFENFKKLFDPVYLNIMVNSLKIAFITTISALLLAYPLAYIISKTGRKIQQALFMLIILPYWTNSLVRTYSFLIVLRSDGIINKLLMMLGAITEPLQLLYTEGAVIFAMIYLLLPVMFLPIYSSITKLDFSFVEASHDLGANKFQTFLSVILPLTIPGVMAGTILVFTPCLGLFFISDLIGGGKTVLLGNIIRDQFTSTRNLPFGSALSVLMMLFALFFIAIYYKTSYLSNTKTGEQNNE